ncbi:MAG: tetratricopeptide repeat protein, partial [Agitococcus sp.]|nr:tetratricopeptide repeat protein [Agitococcus sp.]
MKNKILIAFATRWGAKFGGINSFNTDLLSAVGAAFFEHIETVCIVLSADKEEIEDAKNNEVHLISLDSSSNSYDDSLIPAITQKINSLSSDSAIVCLGHDRITGTIAIKVAQELGGQSAVIHHMSYHHYESFTENSQLAQQKIQEQKRIFNQASIVLAVGPLLRDALTDLLDDEKEVHTLIAGLADISVKNTPKTFKAFLSGRLSQDAQKLKQAYLGIAAFAKAIYQATQNTALPDALKAKNSPSIELRGVDFEQHNSKIITAEEQELIRFAESYANRAITLHALPFTTDRNELFSSLKNATVAMMPSWHEGFGLVAWEAIAAGVPLIISDKSGVYKFLEEYEQGLYTSYVHAIDVAGQSDTPFFTTDDLNTLADALLRIAKDAPKEREKSFKLRTALLQNFTWKNCAESLVTAFNWPTTPSKSHIVQTHPEQKTSVVTSEDNIYLEVPKGKWQKNYGFNESMLLRAEEAIIPFSQKQQDFINLQQDWLNDDKYQLAVRLLIGAGGVGKTRLALHLCQLFKTQGWQVGFLTGEIKASNIAPLIKKIQQLNQATLIVLDYAETRQGLIIQLINAILNSQTKEPRIRLLLLARDSGEWWEQLPSKNATSQDFLNGSATTGPYSLPKLHEELRDREDAYHLALDTFAIRLGLANKPQGQPDLTAPYFAYPLYVQMAALLALLGERPKSAEGLTRGLVNHEQRYWQTLVMTEQTVSSQQAELLMVLATLLNGIVTEREIEKLWLKLNEPKFVLRTLFRLLTPLYPHTKQGLQGLKPDILGEALIAQYLLKKQGVELLVALLGTESCSQWRESVLTVLSRLINHRDDVNPIIEQALIQSLSACAKELVSVIVATPSSLPSITLAAFNALVHQEKLQVAGILNQAITDNLLPLTSIKAAALAALVTTKAQKQHKSDNQKSEYAGLLMDYASALDDDGQLDHSFSYTQKSFDLIRFLALKQPEKFNPDLASAFNNLAICLSEQGKLDEALDYAQQALTIYQQLAQQKPEKFNPDLASAFNNLANRLSEQGKIDEALDYAQQALTIYQQLAQQKPEKFNPDLALAFNNLAIRLSEQGKLDEALYYSQQALTIYQQLAQQ